MHPVLELARRRADEGSVPGNRRDSFRLGLAIEGGGMRGVISAGMVTALQYLGLTNVFDAVYGTSGGAINGAYFLAGQAPYGTTIYYENINNRDFISYFRLLTGRPAMSLEYLLSDVMIHQKVLDWEAVIDSPIPLKVLVTSVDSPSSVVLEGFRSREELFEALCASARIPFLAGAPVEIDGEWLFDGGILEALPFRAATRDLCTHVLVLHTLPEMTLRTKPGVLERLVSKLYMSRFGRAFVHRMDVRLKSYRDDVIACAEATLDPRIHPHIYMLQPPKGTPRISRTETDGNRLMLAAKTGVEVTYDALGHGPARVHQILSPFDSAGRPLPNAGLR